jgi:hypothetical protein
MSQATQNAFEAGMAAAGSKATYGGASASILGWIVSSEVGIMVGILVGLAGLLVNWYYRYKKDRREQREHEKRMQG